ncbi:conserved unknown protein [Ectocarpus siliculosus]|uniref:AAA+ ATPase domain-containing protein n=1 Tax=Ectocarpus siliculosus TaxID=2880 RepID=D7G3V5_ECTSI|nr:conserved unknown protein [Ectocarpus siliculosus]|eukprot:CBJ33632.1 conserved unknown protein [Ectocarpus siliculosus]
MAMIVSQAQMAASVEEEPAATATSAATISVLDAVRVMGSLTWWGVDLAMETAGYGVCPFADDPVEAARRALQDGILAQPLALESLDGALSSWHYSRQSDRYEPLVVALTGSTGTGKTETAWVLADALLTKRCRITGGTRDIPRGLLVLNGADYMVAAKVEEYQSLIRRKLGQRLEYCGGNVVVLFDELQKAAPGTLDALAEAMSEHPRVTFERGGQNVSVDSSRVVFLLVSDVGAEGVNAAVLRYRKRSDVVPGALQSAVKRSLDEQWERLRFGKMVDKVVPYLPMDPASNLLVVELKLKKLAETLDGGLYTTSGLRWHLVQPQYIQYSSYHVTLPNDGREEIIRHQLAAYGARDVEKVSMRRLTGAIRNHVLNPTCAATDEGAEETGSPEGQGRGGGGGRPAQGGYGGSSSSSRGGGGGRCWSEPFMVDIRYDASTEQVSFHRCEPDYADGLTELQREHPDVVEGPKCDLAWRGVLHEHGALA